MHLGPTEERYPNPFNTALRRIDATGGDAGTAGLERPGYVTTNRSIRLPNARAGGLR
jgi:hypothetical protein